MLNCPCSKILIYKFSILSKKTNRWYWECKHILMSDFCHYFHVPLLEFNNFFLIINHKCSIRKFCSTKKSLKIWSIEYWSIGKSWLRSITKIWLIYCIDKSLELLFCVIFLASYIIAIINILLPKIKHIWN